MALVVLLATAETIAGVGFTAGEFSFSAIEAASTLGGGVSSAGLVRDVAFAIGFSGSSAVELGFDVPESTRLGIAIGASTSLVIEVSLTLESEAVGIDDASFFPPKFLRPSTLAAPALSSSDILVKWYNAPIAMAAKIRKTLYRRIRNIVSVWCWSRAAPTKR